MDWALPAICVIVLAFAAVSRRLDGTSITAPMVFTGAGLLLGAKAAGLVDPEPNGSTVKMLASATLAVVLFGDAARIDFRALREEYRVPARLLGIGLPLAIVAGLVAGLALFGSLEWPEALVLAVVLAPTDAALGQSVVTLPSLPSLIRQGLNVESGLNDGLCVPIFYIAIAVASAEAGLTGSHHAVTIVAEEIGYGVLAGAGSGRARRRDTPPRRPPRTGRAPVATGRAGRSGGARVHDGHGPRRLGVHRGVRRRNALRWPPPPGGRRGRLSRGGGWSAARSGDVRRLRGRVPRAGARRDHVVGGRVRAPQPHGREDGARGNRDARHRRPPADPRLPRLVRASWSRLDRVRGADRGTAQGSFRTRACS